jgi:transcriptional regulator with XRE-family HTH domain
VTILGGMLLRELLAQKGVAGPSDLGRRLEISRQHASLLWHGKVLPSPEMLRKLRDRLGVSLDELAELERAIPLKRRGPRPKPPPKKMFGGIAPQTCPETPQVLPERYQM